MEIHCSFQRWFIQLLILAIVHKIDAQSNYTSSDRCENGHLTYELVTGYRLETKPMDEINSVADITDCLRRCTSRVDCKSINFETGFCILNKYKADTGLNPLKPAQFPVFTIYAEKICLKGLEAKRKCGHRAWSHERVIGFQLTPSSITSVSRREKAFNKESCIQKCLDSKEFNCRSVNYNSNNQDCFLFEVDRHALRPISSPSSSKSKPKVKPLKMDSSFHRSSIHSIDYLENNCIDDPTDCEFKPLKGLVLKTVDNVHRNVRSKEECQIKCLHSPYRCHSFDFGADTEPEISGICRTSHLGMALVNHIDEAYVELPGAVTYELISCLNVTIECFGKNMVARIRSDKLFNGKIYAKTKPNSCVNDIKNQLDFDLRLPYNDLMCDVTQVDESTFTSEIVIQHHDQIVTQQDFGFSLKCRFDLSNRTVSNVPLTIDGSLKYNNFDYVHTETVASPNITMSILDENGNPIQLAHIGDQLMLRFDIVDDKSPFEMFIQELVAVDGSDSAEIVLIDRNGCPTDGSVMTGLSKAYTGSSSSAKTLQASFEAFKFPSSDVVQFRALIVPCLPSCKPVQCNLKDGEAGIDHEVLSYGRRRRRRRRQVIIGHRDFDETRQVRSGDLDVVGSEEDIEDQMRRTTSGTTEDEVVVVGTLRIEDGFKVDKNGKTRVVKEKNVNTDGNRFLRYRAPSPAESVLHTSQTEEDKSLTEWPESDHIGDEEQKQGQSPSDGLHSKQRKVNESVNTGCTDLLALIFASVVFLIAQLILLFIWFILWRKTPKGELDFGSTLGDTLATNGTRHHTYVGHQFHQHLQPQSHSGHHNHNHQHHQHNQSHQSQFIMSTVKRSGHCPSATNPSSGSPQPPPSTSPTSSSASSVDPLYKQRYPQALLSNKRSLIE